jgi:hypothetical protein
MNVTVSENPRLTKPIYQTVHVRLNLIVDKLVGFFELHGLGLKLYIGSRRHYNFRIG